MNEQHEKPEVIDLGAVTELTQGMMGVAIEGFLYQPHAGLSDD